jgi:hypothetical protein
MPILVGCPACLTKLNLADALAGKAIKCPKCASILRVPGAAGSSASARRPIQTAPGEETVEELEEVEEGPAPPRRAKEIGGDLSIDDVPRRFQERISRELSRRERLLWVGQPNGWLVMIRTLPGFLICLFMVGLFGVGVGFVILQLFGLFGLRVGKVDDPLQILEVVACFGLEFIWICGTIWILFNAFRASRACYALTSRRAVVWSVRWNGRLKVRDYSPDRLARTRRVDSWFVQGAGDLIFRTKTVVTVTQGKYGGASTSITHYGFLAIDDVSAVERLLHESLIDPHLDRITD